MQTQIFYVNLRYIKITFKPIRPFKKATKLVTEGMMASTRSEKRVSYSLKTPVFAFFIHIKYKTHHFDLELIFINIKYRTLLPASVRSKCFRADSI